ncbi:MAG: V-type ATP synthase subunit E [Betaproteobacteria bacterium]
MSNLERLRETLAREAAEEAAEIRAEAERRAEEIRAEAEAKAERLMAEARAAAQQEIERRQRQLEAEVKLLRRQTLLATKAELVRQVMAEALRKLTDLPEAEYRELILHLIAGSTPRGRVTVVLNRRDRERFGEGFVKKNSRELAAGGIQAELVLSPEPAEFAGGVKLVGPDFEVDCSFERLLELVADEVEPEVAKVLFG